MTRQPTEGDVVDADQNLADLCRRMRETGRSSCSVLFCSGDVFVEQSSAPKSTPQPLRQSPGAPREG